MQEKPAKPSIKLTGTGSAKNLRLAMLAALPLAVLLAYWPILSNGFVDIDDKPYIILNEQVQNGLTPETFIWAFTSVNVANWHPVTMLSLALDVTLFGLNPTGHHAMAMALAAVNSVLLVVVLHRLSGSFYRSLCVGFIFALHPIHVESIAWASSRKDLLSLLFALLTVYVYAEWTTRKTTARHVMMLSLFLLALMSKPTVVTLPAVLLLLDFWPLKRAGGNDFHQALKAYRRDLPALIKEKLGLITVSVTFSLLVFFVQRADGAVADADRIPVGMRMINAVVSYAFYLKKLVWPDDLVFLYHHPGWWPMWMVLLSAALLAIVTAAVFMIARAADARYLPVGWLWFLGTMLPMSGLIQVGEQSMADRYAYFTFIGLYIACVWGAADAARKLTLPRPVTAACMGVIVSALGVTTYHQAQVWRDSLSLYTHHANTAGPHPHIQNNLGVIYSRNGQPEVALKHFEKSIAMEPGNAEVYGNYGNALVKLDRLPEALHAFQKAIEIDRSHALAWLRIGMIQSAMGQLDEACKTYEAFARARPDLAEPLFHLGQTRERQGNADHAAQLYKQAVEINPRFAAAYEALGNLLIRKADIPGAEAAFAKAESLYRQAIDENPSDSDAYNSLGAILAQKGDIAGAEKLFAKSVELAPANRPAQENLARARAILTGKQGAEAQ